jgi:hypothetical protein
LWLPINIQFSKIYNTFHPMGGCLKSSEASLMPDNRPLRYWPLMNADQRR